MNYGQSLYLSCMLQKLTMVLVVCHIEIYINLGCSFLVMWELLTTKFKKWSSLIRYELLKGIVLYRTKSYKTPIENKPLRQFISTKAKD